MRASWGSTFTETVFFEAWLPDLISFMSEFEQITKQVCLGGKGLSLDFGFVVKSLTSWVADSHKHFLNTSRNESRFSPSKNVADETWLFLYLQSDECLS